MNKKTEEMRSTSRAIIKEVKKCGKQSVRKLAELLNLGKSSIQRHLQAEK